MSRRPKGPRLYLRQGRVHARTGKPVPDVWVIRDGSVERSTGFSADELGAAEQALATYIAAKWTPGPKDEAGVHSGDPAHIFVAELLALYLDEKAPKAPDPSAVGARIKALLAWWGKKRLSDVKRSTCQAYVEHRMTQPIAAARDKATARRVSAQGARRELEDLSAAIGYWAGEHPLTSRPKVTLPPKPESSRDALTRAQAARLLMAARGYKLDGQGPEGRPKWKRLRDSGPANRAHIKRFILLGLYTGTRPGVIPKLLWEESLHQAWVDLDAGIVYRRGKRERDHKTKRRPLVRLPSRLLAHLRRWRAADLRAQERRREALKRTGEDPNTFALSSVLHHGGRPISGKIRRGFEGCVRDAGLPEEVTPHWMRHTAATWLMERGCDPWEASGYLGMNVKTLLDHYGHHRPDHQASARLAMRR